MGTVIVCTVYHSWAFATRQAEVSCVTGAGYCAPIRMQAGGYAGLLKGGRGACNALMQMISSRAGVENRMGL